MGKSFFVYVIISCLIPISCASTNLSHIKYMPHPIKFSNIHIGGELKVRVEENYCRLEEIKYQPDHVYLTEKQSGGWPGDTEGRTILGLVMDAQACGREPRYLSEILKRLPAHLNSEGYMGPIYSHVLNEQQLAGNGWLLRGLCEYYLWKRDKRVLPIIRSIVTNLYIKGKGLYRKYPVNPNLRSSSSGGASGSIQKNCHQWMLSTDIGCVFIGMDGAIQAYDILRIPELKSVIDEMIRRFLSIDLEEIKAQTHASLTACRGLVRYAEITGNKKYIDEVVKRWQLYESKGMTECYGNYNWFNRYDSWTEPCAIVDSYMLAVQLWLHTGNPTYLDDAELIYYNALAHAQRSNGGFGCDNCPGLSSKTLYLESYIDEASWCCTMRGGEGLSRAVEYSYFTKENVIYIPFFHSSSAMIPLCKGRSISLVQSTNYPFDNQVILKVKQGRGENICIKMSFFYWMNDPRITLNGRVCRYKKNDGFVEFHVPLKTGDVIKYSFNQSLRYEPTLNKENTAPGDFKVLYGPLLLASTCGVNSILKRNDKLYKTTSDFGFRKAGSDILLVPVYDLLDKNVCVRFKSIYKRQVIFESK